jgi:type I restriction enzyme S subunit
MNISWQSKNLGAVCEVITRGISPKYTETGGIPVLNQRCIRDHQIDFTIARRHDVEVKAFSKEKLIKIGDVLVNSTGTGTLGRVAQVKEITENMTVDSHVTIVRPNSSMFYEPFFGYMLIKIEEEISLSGEGASGQTELARETLKSKFTVSYPESLQEQQRIVSILDKAFESIAVAKENIEKNIKNVKELWETSLKLALESNNTLSPLVPLGHITEITSSKRIYKEEYTRTGVPFYRTKEIAELDRGEEISLELFISQNRYNDIKTKYGIPKPGDLLLTAIGTIGNTYIVKLNDEFYFKDGNVLWIKLSDKLQPHYLQYVIKSFINRLNALSKGSTYNALPIEKLKVYEIYLPSRAIQSEIIDYLDKIRVEVDKLIKLLAKNLSLLDELKKSILAKAFRGEL